jgi:hypothetical protein
MTNPTMVIVAGEMDKNETSVSVEEDIGIENFD